MSIGWGDGQVPGSPFKVTVAAGTDPCKVVFNGDGISTGIVGQILTSSIDVSKAGPGKIVVFASRFPRMIQFSKVVV